MPPLTQRLLGDLAAAGTDLRGVLGIHGYDGATGSFSLVVQHSLEHPQPGVVGRQCQVSVFGDKPQGQILDRDQRIGLGQAVGYLVPKVFALIRYLLIQSCHPRACLQRLEPPLALRASERWARRSRASDVRSQRGLSMRVPSEQASRDRKPLSTPTAFPVRNGGAPPHRRSQNRPTSAPRLAGQGNVFQASFGDRPVEADAHLADVLEVEQISFDVAACTQGRIRARRASRLPFPCRLKTAVP